MRPLLWFLLCFVAVALTGQERILNYNVDLALDDPRTMSVTEEITVVSEGKDIKRGIFRTLPRSGTYRYAVTAVTRDGRPEPYVVRGNDTKKVYIGDRKKTISSGTYVYRIEYRADHRISDQEEVDDLYWQVTGAEWDFPIESVTATVRFPDAVRVIQYACYTGGSREAGRDCAASRPDSTSVRFMTTAPLGRREGLTVGVGLSKGYFAAITPAAATADIAPAVPPPPPPPWQRNFSLWVAILGFVGGLYYAWQSWSRHGVDPEPPRVPQQFAPPADISPAAAGYVHSRHAPAAYFTASLMALAVRGYLTIEPVEEAGFLSKSVVYELRSADDPPPTDALPPEQAELFGGLFAAGPVVRLSEEYDKRLSKISRCHAKSLAEQYGPLLREGNNLVRILPLILIYLLTLGLGYAFVGADATGYALPVLVGLTILGALGLVAYGLLIARPTPAKQELKLRLKSLRDYLSMSEGKRKRLLNAPEMNEAHYEALLPYAIALGINKKWSNYFAELLAEGTAYRPRYGRGAHAFDVHRFSTGFQRAVSSGTTAPSSSGGGSGGGGSVGGGGGGGGGGGW